MPEGDLLAQRSRRAAWWRATVSVLAIAALVSLCLEYGFDQPVLPKAQLVGVQLLAVAGYIVAVFVRVFSASTLLGGLRRYGWEFALILVGAVLLAVEYEARRAQVLKAGAVYVGTVQVMLVARFVVGAVRWQLEMSQRQLRPGRTIVTAFVVVIAIGGSLLALPKAMTPHARDRLDDHAARRVIGAYFTATSAACVTGLIVFDTGSEYTRFGQVVILVLIQLGGLGIMIFASLFGVMTGRQLSLRQSLVLQDAYSENTLGEMKSTIRFIVAATLVCELVGAVLCYPMFAARHAEMGERLFYCAFHAVSAFCNAGFALQADSLVGYAGAWGVYLSIMPLIVVGGLGFPVLRDLFGWCRTRLKAALWPRSGVRSLAARRPRYRLRLHTRLVLATSLTLIVGGAVLLFAFESIAWRAEPTLGGAGSMSAMSVIDRARAALFQSITARTAGFNSVPLDAAALSPGGHALLIILMFIGGSPASTAGGIKTVALAVLIVSVLSTLRSRNRAEAFRRTIPQGVIERAALVLVLMSVLVAITTLGLCMTTPGTLRELTFEAVSACGTVGLSTGLTVKLTVPAQLLIMAAMFAGRLGPLTVMIALAGGEPSARYEYPEEPVAIG